MAGVTGQFADALNRKYANLESQTEGENQLRDAQSQQILAQTRQIPFNDASRRAQEAAQTGLIGANTQQVAPLAQSSIADTNAGIGLKGAQAGFYGAQTTSLLDDFNPASTANALAYHGSFSNNGAAGTSTSFNANPTGGPVTGSLGSFFPPTVSRAGNAQVQQFSGGTANVQPKGSATMMTPPPSPAPQVQTAAPAMGLMDHIQGIVHHAMHAMHASGGMSNVPSPGQTTSNGSWEGAQPTMSTPMNPPSPTPNQDLRAKMGYGVKASGGMTEVDASGGTSKVPGKGNPGVDKVPATLAPGEAVLNQGAAMHMGRGAIATLNALGAHAMAAQGTPPMGPGANTAQNAMMDPQPKAPLAQPSKPSQVVKGQDGPPAPALMARGMKAPPKKGSAKKPPMEKKSA